MTHKPYNSSCLLVTTTRKRFTTIKMPAKFVFSVLLITFAFAHGRDLSNIRSTHEIISAEKESRIIDIPLIGGIFFLGCQVVGLLLSKVWSVLQYKYAAFSLISSVVSWLLRHYMVLIIGAVAVAGFCIVSSFFSSEPVYEIEHLVRTVRSLDQGLVKYVS